MTPWDDLAVTHALSDVVLDLGRPAAFDPTRLRAGLEQALARSVGDQAVEYAGQVDALVIAAEEGVPEGMLFDVPAIDLADRLDARGVPADQAGWALQAWGRAVRITDPAITAGLAIDQAQAAEAALAPARSARHGLLGRLRSARHGLLGRLRSARHGLLGRLRSARHGLLGRLRSARHGLLGRLRDRGGLIAVIALALVLLVGIGIAGTLLVRGSGGTGLDDAQPALQASTPGASSPSSSRSGSATAAPAVPLVLAYRGGSERFPADTLPGLLDSARTGAAVAADLRWTSDDVPVLVPGARVQPPMYCAKQYRIADTSWAQLKASCLTQASVSADGRSYGIPQLSAAVAALADVKGAQLFLEIKVAQTAAQRKALLSVLDTAGMTDRTVITSFLPGQLASVHGADGGADLRLMQFVRDRNLTPAQARTAGLWAVALDRSALDAGYVRQLRAAGLKVVAWTPNTPARWAAAKAAGVDYVNTDKPRAYRTWAASQSSS